MPRHPRLFIPGTTYYVYCRVAHGEFVFDATLEADELITEDDRGPQTTFGISVLSRVGPLNHGPITAVEPQSRPGRQLKPVQTEVEAERARRGDPHSP